jgi:hypothetical protein
MASKSSKNTVEVNYVADRHIVATVYFFFET